MATNLSAAAIDALSAIKVTGNAATMPPLDRKTYIEVNGALITLGGIWTKKAKAHIFPGDPREAIERIVVDGEFTDRVKELEFFETPRPLADHLVFEARIANGMNVLEPSAGKGAIVAAIRAVHSGLCASVTAFELNSNFARVLGSSGLNVDVQCRDFLAMRIPNIRFDRVVMNPPFSTGKDMAHITRAFGWLKPGGRLVAVAAQGVTFRQDKRAVAFRELVKAHGHTKELPAGSFKASGTMVNTVMVVLNKPG